MIDIKGFIPVSLIDYPGKICSVIFLGGCNFRCYWCHNYDLVDEQKLNKIKNIELSYIFDFIEKRRKKIDGICISGGEPTIHGEKLIEFIRDFKKKKVLVKLDTNGSNPMIIKILLKENLIDFIAIDIKNTPIKYPKTIGLKFFDFSNITETLEILKESKIPFQARTTLVDDLVDRDEMVNLAKELNIEIFFQDYRKKV